MRVLFIAVVVGLFAACAAPRSERCRRICEREDHCTRGQDDYKFDQNECEAACTSLERDERGRVSVDNHEMCVEAAASECSAVLECML